MRKVMVGLLALAVISMLVKGGYAIWDRATQVPAAELRQVVARDGTAFPAGAIPDEVLDQLAAHRVVLLGETHFISEHKDFTAELLRGLHARGFRQFLFEWTQAADWALQDFVNHGEMTADWDVPYQLGDPVVAIREFNQTLPESERIQVHAIDVHIEGYGGTQSWLSYIRYIAEEVLADPGPIADFLEGDHTQHDDHLIHLETLRVELCTSGRQLSAAWGDEWYDTVMEMVEVELIGASVRAMRRQDHDASVRLRETAIKMLADRRIQSTTQGTLINVGSTHAQKVGLWGTEETEWLGDYLAHESPVVAGSIVTVWVPAAYIVSAAGSNLPDSDLATSADNELLRVTHQIWPEQIVFLPLDDRLFRDGRVPINASGEAYVGAPQRHFDALALLPLAHRYPVAEE